MALEGALITWAHLVSAAIWVGGSIFIGVVLAPLLKTISESTQKRLEIMIRVGRRFNKIAVPSLIILFATGTYNAFFLLESPESITSTTYGIVLLVKLGFVASLVAAFAAHVKLIGGKMESKISSGQVSDQFIQKLRSKIILLGKIIVAISVVILLLASMLDAGI